MAVPTLHHFWAPLPANDVRNCPMDDRSTNDAGDIATLTGVADADHLDGRAVRFDADDAASSGTCLVAMEDPFADLTFADGTEVNTVIKISLEIPWVPGADQQVFSIYHTYRGGGTGNYVMQMTVTDTEEVKLQVAGGSITGVLFTMVVGTAYDMRIRLKRLTSTTSEAQLYVLEGGAWVSKGTATGSSAWASWTITEWASLLNVGKDGAARMHLSLVAIYAAGVTPLAEEVPNGVSACLPDGNGPSGGLDWDATNAWVEIDDSVGDSQATQESDWIESSTTAGVRNQDVDYDVMSPGLSGTDQILAVRSGFGALLPADTTDQFYIKARRAGSEVSKDAFYNFAAYGSAGALDSRQGYGSVVFPDDPAGSDWTESNVNDIEMRFTRTASPANNVRLYHSILQVLTYTPYVPVGQPILRRSASVPHMALGQSAVRLRN